MDTFHTLAEIAVAVTGFTSLIFVFRGRTASWNRQDYISLTFALCWGIGSLFLSLLPGPMHAWYVTAIVLLMLHATAEMGLFVLQSIRRADPL